MKTSTTALSLILAATSQVAFSAQQDKGLRHLGPSSSCLIAEMSASNGYDDVVEGTVEVCFNNPLGANTGSLTMSVVGLPVLIAGGVHIHAGTDCAAAAQGGHYWNKEILTSGGPRDDGDAWFNIASSLAPTGAGYSTDEDGKGSAYFFFENGYGYGKNKGHAVVIHGEVGTPLGDGQYERIACGILE
jgi:Cu/Zn superoxide dismutase